MKCPRCWTDKAYLRRIAPWKRLLFGLLLLVPMKCQHCYHKFTVSWFVTIGKPLRPPILRIAPITRGSRPSYAARHYAAMRDAGTTSRADDHERPRRADAA